MRYNFARLQVTRVKGVTSLLCIHSQSQSFFLLHVTDGEKRSDLAQSSNRSYGV